MGPSLKEKRKVDIKRGVMIFSFISVKGEKMPLSL